jgi:hypothetical protein
MNRSNPTTDPREHFEEPDPTGETKLPPLDAVPRLLVSAADARTLARDHHAGIVLSLSHEDRVLSLVDGRRPVAEIVELSGLPRREVLRLFARWRAFRFVTCGAPDAAHE